MEVNEYGLASAAQGVQISEVSECSSGVAGQRAQISEVRSASAVQGVEYS
jgi:hypothetical protein